MFPQFLPQFRASTLGINLVPPALVLGLINHLYFHRFEPKSADIPILVLTIEPLLLLVVFSVPFSLIQVLKAYFVFLSSLCLSIIIYRISPWHPLSDIPGPTLNKITQLRSIWSSRAGDQHRVNKRLHDTYGPFVRTGPNEISIIHVDAVKGVLGSGGFPKGQWYEARTDPSLPTRSLLALRGEAHANRRRIWNRCMSSESLLNYGPILANRVAQLASRLEGLSGSVDMSEWIGFFTYGFLSLKDYV
ncbi:cytochrome P450 [Mycena sp. CBHHK59/15]|nr:cytochrome P450 [Mycena sp. CBHHK59/15]